MLRLDKLKHIYNNTSQTPRQILDIPEWELEPGQQVLLRGVSGSGKTSLFNIIAGLMQPTAGRIWFEGTDLYKLGEAQRDHFRAQHIGYVFQNHYLLPTLTTLENVIMPMMFARALPAQVRKERATVMLQQVGLQDHLDHRPARLSTGQRMRVAVARALVNQPALVLADEPTASLDSASAQSTMNLIQDVCQKANAILIVASHDPALFARFPQIVDLKEGHLQRNNEITEEITTP
ncbi:ABC transporter ATP-binding protein [Phototrophicus methaneseepsis]|uniref:ABC transporter ATP-binding protein n=1 Tax=Phototrophicus methaneseepsis TaxID=2710758 RepID=A0A7S8E6H2_9CHLR|nr:ABC transporter ATP-binding protein [Phototrophicus methaneseepsis]QPC81264.1 ABC transporter ATP-binding protein [Phototrophicus methaneseepsis]